MLNVNCTPRELSNLGKQRRVVVEDPSHHRVPIPTNISAQLIVLDCGRTSVLAMRPVRMYRIEAARCFGIARAHPSLGNGDPICFIYAIHPCS